MHICLALGYLHILTLSGKRGISRQRDNANFQMSTLTRDRKYRFFFRLWQNIMHEKETNEDWYRDDRYIIVKRKRQPNPTAVKEVPTTTWAAEAASFGRSKATKQTTASGTASHAWRPIICCCALDLLEYFNASTLHFSFLFSKKIWTLFFCFMLFKRALLHIHWPCVFTPFCGCFFSMMWCVNVMVFLNARNLHWNANLLLCSR